MTESPSGPVDFPISLSDQPTWHTLDWVGTLVDFRPVQHWQLPSTLPECWQIKVGPAITLSWHRDWNKGAQDAFLVLQGSDGSRTGIAVDSKTKGVMGKSVPGLDPLQNYWFRDNDFSPYDEDSPYGCWESVTDDLHAQIMDAAWAGAISLHAALSNPRAWLNPRQPWQEPWPPTSEDTLALTRWASYQAPDRATYRLWASQGIVNPQVLDQWRATGWADLEIGVWVRHFADDLIARQYQLAGMEPAKAALWHRNAKPIHPITALRLAGRNAWAPTTGHRLMKLVARAHPGALFADPYEESTDGFEGDSLLCAWADLENMPPRRVLMCVAAGLAADEARDLVAAGSLDESHLRTLAALRAG